MLSLKEYLRTNNPESIVGKWVKPMPGKEKSFRESAEVKRIFIRTYFRNFLDFLIEFESDKPVAPCIIGQYSLMAEWISIEESDSKEVQKPAKKDVSLKRLQELNKNGNYCVRCGKPLEDIDLEFKVVKGCMACEEELVLERQ